MNCKNEKKSQCCLVKKIRGYMYNKIYKHNNLCKNKHIACEIYESYAPEFDTLQKPKGS